MEEVAVVSEVTVATEVTVVTEMLRRAPDLRGIHAPAKKNRKLPHLYE
jgi:hypothetical protein